jgi:transposase
MGRSRGGLTTKIHAVVDACGLPITLKLTEGQAHDGRSAQDMLGTVGRGDVLVADRAYDSNALRETLIARGAKAAIRAMPNRLKPPRFNRRLYRKRNLVERFFNKLKHFRAVATRYDKRDDNYLASVQLASIRIWMRFNESMA